MTVLSFKYSSNPARARRKSRYGTAALQGAAGPPWVRSRAAHSIDPDALRAVPRLSVPSFRMAHNPRNCGKRGKRLYCAEKKI